MQSTFPAVERLIYGYLLEEGVPIADGFGVLNPDGTGTFIDTAELPGAVNIHAHHSIEEWEGTIWPLTNVNRNMLDGVNYDLTHAMLGVF